MKKTFLASTALATAAMIVAGPALAEGIDISMFSNFIWSGGDQDSNADTTDIGHDFATNTEIHFKGSKALDNGITVGFAIEMEGDTSEDSGNASVAGNGGIDENSFWFEGSFGKVQLGNNDGAADVYGVNATYVGVKAGGISNPTGTILSALRTTTTGTDVNINNDGGDDPAITYFTPRFSGIQAAIGYGADETIDNLWGFGLSYKGEFSGVGVDLGAHYATGANGVAGVDDNDRAEGYLIGAKLGYQGFSLASGYSQNDLENATGKTDETVWNVGVGYANDQFSVALAYLDGEEDQVGTSIQDVSLSIGYTVAPGVSVFASGIMGESRAATGGVKTDYEMLTLGTAISF